MTKNLPKSGVPRRLDTLTPNRKLPKEDRKLPEEKTNLPEATLEEVVAKAAEAPKKVEIQDMPLNSIEDYGKYNRAARAANKKLRICRYPIKQCPIELHPKQRIVFNRNDQPENALPVFVSDHLIHYDEVLYPGQAYDLPYCIIHHLEKKGYPVWKWVDKPDGGRETIISHKNPRFSLRTVFTE